MTGEIVYFLCAVTSSLCAALLLGQYRQNRMRLLFWSGLGFVGLSANNILLFLDMVIWPTRFDLSVVRTIPAVLGLMAMIWGFTWDE